MITLFPEAFQGFLETSILGRARAQGVVAVDLINPRYFATDRHHTCDDYPYGGGAGMVLKPEPLACALEAAGARSGNGQPHVIYLTPGGTPLTQARVGQLAELSRVILVAGRYEGIDQRIVDLFVDEELSVGDYVLAGGEVAAMCVIEAVARVVDGVIQPRSLEDESFSSGLLEYPQYTRPEEFRGQPVPAVLLSGNHGRIAQWRREQSEQRTARVRPDLMSGVAR